MRFTTQVISWVLFGGAYALAQSQAIGWGTYGFDSEVSRHVPLAVSAGDWVTTVLTTSGKVFSRGLNSLGECAVPELPAGRRYTQVASAYVSVAIVDDGTLRQWGRYPGQITTINLPVMPAGVVATKVVASRWFAAVVCSDGQIRAWGRDVGSGNLVPPVLPQGITYVDLTIGDGHGYGLRSDGTWVSWGANTWGERNGPTPPQGVGVAKVVAGYLTSAALLTDGTIQVWGYLADGQGNVPLSPPGVPYMDVSIGQNHCLAKLANGSLVSWGGNTFGQCTIPPLPAGHTYMSFSAGRSHSLALRSDGAVVSFGYRTFDGPAMAVPPGETLRTIKTGGYHCLAVTSGGSLIGTGADQNGQLDVPTLPAGVTWVDCAAGALFSVGLASDGGIRAFGHNGYGECNVPPLPPGLTYTHVACGFRFSVARRSDGSAVTWGTTPTGPVQVPSLPPGLTYRAVGAGDDYALLIRSDGSLVLAGAPFLPGPPALPPGVEYVEAQGSNWYAIALRSDGEVAMWSAASGSQWLPKLPRGQHYVGVAAMRQIAYARRSDGSVVDSYDSGHGMPVFAPGSSCHAIDAGWDFLAVATVGSKSTYVGYASGCDPTGVPSQIVPSDTPKLGQTMTLRLDRMTANVGWMIFGWSRLQPSADLANIGMPGCYLHVQPDILVAVVGSLGWGQVPVTVPNHPSLLGVAWRNQAFLLDPSANALGAKVSTASEAVVGG